ncbi:WD40 repeat-like protein [Mycena pura]|uniref:WD40 repeat-like protein n=1 Tax=Mycena pura TaxID=153505 RepID=A0AAD6VMD8_9AGAR|nr:WD40 repeat-like protein [Mycena pura]
MNQHETRPSYGRRRPVLIPDLRNHAPFLQRPQCQRKRTVEALLAHGFPYSKNLDAHASCVNALAFSSTDGRFLASGGDDLRIHLWDLHEERVSTPCCTLQGHRRNIFVLEFSAHNKFLFSGGLDETVLQYDASQLERPLLPQTDHRWPDHAFLEHTGSIRGIAPHAVQDEIFLTGSEDGRIILHDGRVHARAQHTLQLTREVTGVRFHPAMEHIFATSDGQGRVCLRDMRMAFGPRSQRTREGVVQLYNTKISRRPLQHLANPETSSIVFNRQGTQLAVTMLNYLPTIYALSDPDPVAVCSAQNLPDGTPVPEGARTYGNQCTMKAGSFGGPGLDEDVLYLAGSDDFRAYVWALPSPQALAAQRTVISPAEWDAGEHKGIVAFAESTSAPRCVPAQLDTPRARLGGHASIVNTVVVHPRILLAATSGVESRVVLHGAVDSLLGGMKPTSAQTREIGEAWDGDGGDEVDEVWGEDQRGTIRLFDACVASLEVAVWFIDSTCSILRREAEDDVFVVRPWTGDSDEEATEAGAESEEVGTGTDEDEEMESAEEDSEGSIDG